MQVYTNWLPDQRNSYVSIYKQNGGLSHVYRHLHLENS